VSDAAIEGVDYFSVELIDLSFDDAGGIVRAELFIDLLPP
jgi:hypothetical protein